MSGTLRWKLFRDEGGTGMIYLKCVVIQSLQASSRGGLSWIITCSSLDNVILLLKYLSSCAGYRFYLLILTFNIE